MLLPSIDRICILSRVARPQARRALHLGRSFVLDRGQGYRLRPPTAREGPPVCRTLHAPTANRGAPRKGVHPDTHDSIQCPHEPIPRPRALEIAGVRKGSREFLFEEKPKGFSQDLDDGPGIPGDAGHDIAHGEGASPGRIMPSRESRAGIPTARGSASPARSPGSPWSSPRSTLPPPTG